MVGGTVGGKYDADAVFAPDRGTQGGADTDGDAGADDAVGTQVARVRIGDVHRTAEAAAVPRCLARDLGEHAVEACTAGQTVAVSAVRADDVVILTEGGADARGDGLFAQVGMQVTADVAQAIETDAGLLKATDAVQRTVEAGEEVGVIRSLHEPKYSRLDRLVPTGP